MWLGVCGCQSTDSNNSTIDVGRLYVADPLDDFRKSVENKDYRFVGIYGYALSVPGVNPICIDPDRDVKLIEGTSDTYSSYEEEKFNVVARVYADHYNFQLKQYLKGRNMYSCDE